MIPEVLNTGASEKAVGNGVGLAGAAVGAGGGRGAGVVFVCVWVLLIQEKEEEDDGGCGGVFPLSSNQSLDGCRGGSNQGPFGITGLPCLKEGGAKVGFKSCSDVAVERGMVGFVGVGG